MRTHRLLGAAATIAAAALSAASVSGCGSTANVVDPVARAAVISNQSTGYRMTLSMRLSSGALPAPITATGNGIVDVPGHKASVNLDMNLASIPQVTQVLGTGTLSFQELVDGTTVYLKLPASLAGKIPGFAKPWVKLDLARAASAAGIPGLSSLTSNPASSDPSQLLRYLRAASGNVTKVGTETVNGIPTTHYRAQISLDRVPSAYPASSRAQIRQAVAGLERIAGTHSLPVEVWVDPHHLVRQMRFSYDENVSGAGALGVVITADIPEYGPQPAPVVPPAGQVQDITGLAGTSG